MCLHMPCACVGLNLVYSPHFLGVDVGSLPTLILETAMLTAAIAVAGTVLDKEPFGSGRFSFTGAKYFSKDLSLTLTPAVCEDVV